MIMWPEIKEAYRSGWSFALAFPLLFAVPVLIEFIQHVIEIRIGMYVDFDAHGPQTAIRCVSAGGWSKRSRWS